MKKFSRLILPLLLIMTVLLFPLQAQAACGWDYVSSQRPDLAGIYSLNSFLDKLLISWRDYITQNQPTYPETDNTNPSPGDNPESTPENKPSLPENKPAIPESKPTIPGNKPSVPPTTSPSPGISSYAARVVTLVNEERAKEGLAALRIDNTLCAAAEIRAAEISTKFSHTRPDGSSCFTALAQVGARYSRAGENIAIGQQTPEQVVAEWMASPGHRANILDPRFTRIGVAALPSDSSYYRGYMWAQFFAD